VPHPVGWQAQFARVRIQSAGIDRSTGFGKSGKGRALSWTKARICKSGNNAHVHKEDPGGNQLNDRGIVSLDHKETHIGIRNPINFPLVRGKAHGS